MYFRICIGKIAKIERPRRLSNYGIGRCTDPPDISFPFIKDIYPIMLFASFAGMILFSIVIKELREQQDHQQQRRRKNK